MKDAYGGDWFLAKFQDSYIGEIGLVPFDLEGRKVGRLKDVDIISEYQGQGFGNELLKSTCRIAQKNQFSALCLTADADGWPKEWYSRFGFRKVGERLMAEL